MIMTYSQRLRSLFPGIVLSHEDLFLLEKFQIMYLPDRVPAEEFATLIRTYPVVHRFLVAKYPPIDSFLEKILAERRTEMDQELIEAQCQEALWEIADLIIYNKHPDLCDTQTTICWDIEDIRTIASPEDRVIADVGAGAGAIAFLVAPVARTVFAVEPVASFRSFMREKAVKEGVDNLFIMDGTLDSIPLPGHSLDILITSNAIGWNLEGELVEIERVVKSGGHAIHLIRSDPHFENPVHEPLTSNPWGYTCIEDKDNKIVKLRYYKTI
jgi:SAM-dependent methyltransferase